MRHSDDFPVVVKTKLTWPRRLRVLVIDSDEVAAELMKSILELELHEVVMASNQVEAARISTGNFDAVYFDIKQSGSDVQAIMDAFRHLPGLAGTPFVVLSAVELGSDANFGLLKDVDYFLLKPAGLQQIFQPLRDIAAAEPRQPQRV